ncbi:MAG: AMP-binding protein [Gammaproteobacteria bacterium]|nr:AMP-binding protein [Gammaproteobacteria bacterium]
MTESNDKQVLKKTGIVSGERYLSPDVLDIRSRQAASALHDLGVWQGDQVALLLRNDFAFFEATFGSGLLGASPVPLNWHLSADEIAHILDDSGAKVLIAHADLMSESVIAVCSNVVVIGVRTPDEIAAAYGIADDRCEIPGGIPDWRVWISSFAEWQEAPRSIAGPMFYTSGTTGMPKGVKRKSASPQVVAAIQKRTNAAWGFDRAEVRSVMSGPLYHSAPNAYGLHVVRSGGLLILQPRFDAEELLSLIQQYGITHLHMVPTMFVRLLDLPIEVRNRYDVSSLRFVSHGAAPCPPDIKRSMLNWWGPVIHEYYAMTEIGIATICNSEEWQSHVGTVGHAGPGVDLKIIAEDGSRCGIGEAGEIYVRSEATTRFVYHRDQAKTESARRGDYVATGDIGYLDEDDFLYISDRKTDMVISGGVNIYPAEIESVLVTLDNVRDCVVFGIPDKNYGEKLVAVVDSNGPLDADDIVSQLRSRIASYKIPREYFFARHLPREDSGKIKKRVVRDQYLTGTLVAVADQT